MSQSGLSPGDPSSYSRPDEVKVTNVHLKLVVDFEKTRLLGHVELAVEKVKPNVKHLVLDSKDLKIFKIFDKATEQLLDYNIADPVHTFGSKLTVTLPRTTDSKLVIQINYETSSEASALQWLTPAQTLGKERPYLFSQCQAIHCRSIVPCQDTPSVKSPYSAEITAPEGLVVLMSAVRVGDPVPSKNEGVAVHKFEQKIPVPTYLIAVAVGALESREIGPRSRVWSEKEYVEKAAYEFAETEVMLKTAEDVCGPYVWGIYDLLVLPPSFPYGGMENPCLTFVTPTLLAGDRSLADVVVHEITHSWTGNLVTNKNFEHFWINEGFTMFVERKILGKMHGENYRHFMAIGGLKDLKDAIDARGKDNPTTCLVPDLRGVDPDDAFSVCPYEKGHTLLFHLETILGGAGVFDDFLKSYIDHFKYKSIGTDDFRDYLNGYFLGNKNLEKFDWDTWLRSPGMPPVIPSYDTALADACTRLAARWSAWDEGEPAPFEASDLRDLNAQQVREFLAVLLQGAPLSAGKVQAMDRVYGMGERKNAEIRFRWLRLALKSRWKKLVSEALDFVAQQGRMKYVRPIYRDLYAWDETKEKAIKHFKTHRHNMMHVAAHVVSQDLKLGT
ncbi:leukotriene A-4 hydrolase [Bacillus rossius redtenbacheri]|uniref:leukotriene A-4 hydrolase n=1 Tax=Bacillus rossius redtenbacheri TaxID=93214 RepID=UPI002FDD5BDA